jgi:hypothetical protein
LPLARVQPLRRHVPALGGNAMNPFQKDGATLLRAEKAG